MKIMAIVVIYNKSCAVSTTLRTLEQYAPKLPVMIYDNSTKDYSNANYAKKHHFSYLGDGKNIGLSKAYNQCIKELRGSTDYVIILDDDTTLTEEYFTEVYQCTKEKKADILLPQVKSGDHIISPIILEPHEDVVPAGAGLLKGEWTTGINSGMVVQMDIYDKVWYNEDMFMDYVDHEFMWRVHREGFKVYGLKAEIFQAFSMDEKPPVEQALKRFRIFKQDFAIYHREIGVSYKPILWKLGLEKALAYRDIRFLR